MARAAELVAARRAGRPRRRLQHHPDRRRRLQARALARRRPVRARSRRGLRAAARSRAGPTRCASSTRTSASSPSGIISATPSPATPASASTICCSTRPRPSGSRRAGVDRATPRPAEGQRPRAGVDRARRWRQAPLEPMEALLAEELPDGPGWQYEPKWDGFRCLAVTRRRRGRPCGRSRASRSAAISPKSSAMLGRLKADRFILDGELVIVAGGRVRSTRCSCASTRPKSRVRKLAAATPALFMAFDCLAPAASCLPAQPLAKRRAALEQLLAQRRVDVLLLSPATADRQTRARLARAQRRRARRGHRQAARPALPAGRAGDGQGQAAPHRRLRRRRLPLRARKGKQVGSLLLGLYDDAGLLDHVGFTSSIAAKDRPGLDRASWRRLVGAPGFTGNAPGGPSRWSTERTAEWQPLEPKLVVEVLYDQVTGEPFPPRHQACSAAAPTRRPASARWSSLRHPLTPAQLTQLMNITDSRIRMHSILWRQQGMKDRPARHLPSRSTKAQPSRFLYEICVRQA